MHTPGPWRLGPINYADVYGGPSGQLVALAIKYLDETVDNARLISAAPELLELCKYVRNYARLADLGDDTISRMDSAISKAEGK